MVTEITEGKPKAVRVKGHSVALFKVEGRIYATDNQCPHMGYPLTRGAIRHGCSDRLIPLMMAANGAAGNVGDRPPVEPLPPPVSWEKTENWIRAF
jgi:hypothetical protein